MKLRSARRVISVLDAAMCVAAVAAAWRHLALLWAAAFVMLAVRMYLYLRPYACPHCGQAVRPDRGAAVCPKCGESLDD